MDLYILLEPQEELGKDNSICDETSQWDFANILRSLIPGQTLSAITIPSVFLQPRSLLENLSDLMMHADILDDPKYIIMIIKLDYHMVKNLTVFLLF